MTPLKKTPINLTFAVGPYCEFSSMGFLPWGRYNRPYQGVMEEMMDAVSCDLTRKNLVVMGRNTWESFNRDSDWDTENTEIAVLSKTKKALRGAPLVFSSFKNALLYADNNPSIEKVIVMGGMFLLEMVVHGFEDRCLSMQLIRVHNMQSSECRVIDMSKFATLFSCVQISERLYLPYTPGLTWSVVTYINPTFGKTEDVHEEMQYLEIIRDVLNNGDPRMDRTGVGTVAAFGKTMRFSLKNNRYPLFTTKRVFFKGVVEELLWFIRGDTNAKNLSAKGVKIWDKNGERAVLDGKGLTHREEGDLGPIYGFQWRHFGAEYVDTHTDYTGKGFDQLADCIHKIKNDPTDRRIIMSAWNPADLGQMALPPCHMFCQFFVEGKELSCMMYQRSADLGLGVPFNVASYALLTVMVAHVCGLSPKEFIHVMGDTHVYMNHVNALNEQIIRKPYPFPSLYIPRKVTSIDDFLFSDFILFEYECHKAIPMSMAV